MNTLRNRSLALSTARSTLLAIATACAAQTAHANLLSNPGFEISAFTGAGNVLGNFTGFQGVWGVEMGGIVGPTLGVNPASGSNMLAMTDDFISYTQTFQAVDVSSYAALINAGNAQIDASAYFNTNGGYIGAFGLVNVLFFSSSVYSSLLGNSGNGTLTLDGNPLTWENASVSSLIPVNTTWVVFQVAYQNASIGPNTGFVDDAHLDIRAVPAPGAIALVALAGLVGRRRR